MKELTIGTQQVNLVLWDLAETEPLLHVLSHAGRGFPYGPIANHAAEENMHAGRLCGGENEPGGAVCP